MCGLLVAERLRQHGLRPLILEAGLGTDRSPSSQRRFESAIKPLLAIDPAAWRFRTEGLPFEWIRVRALGGRSLLWGGWCQRMEPQNQYDAHELDACWPITLNHLAPYYQSIERRLGVVESEVPPAFMTIKKTLGLDVVGKRAAVIPSRQRVFCGLDVPRPDLRTNCVCRRLITRDGRVRSIEVFDSRTEESKILDANAFVLCASPVETARLLFDVDLGHDSVQVGAGLVDHLVASALAVIPQPAPRTEPPTASSQSALIPRFVNLPGKPRRDYRSGFCAEIVGPAPLIKLGTAAIRALEIDDREASKLSYLLVHAIGEGHPHADRLVRLDPQEHDSWERPIPVIQLAWSEEQKRMAVDMEETVTAVLDALAPPGSRIIRLREALHPGGIAHEAGTARMGAGAETGVVDSEGAVRAVRGLYIADASVMPTALDRHPTLTLLALALRTADRIVQDRRAGI